MNTLYSNHLHTKQIVTALHFRHFQYLRTSTANLMRTELKFPKYAIKRKLTNYCHAFWTLSCSSIVLSALHFSHAKVMRIYTFAINLHESVVLRAHRILRFVQHSQIVNWRAKHRRDSRVVKLSCAFRWSVIAKINYYYLCLWTF